MLMTAPRSILTYRNELLAKRKQLCLCTAIILHIHGDYPPLFMELKVIQLANGCTFWWHWNILDVYVLILPTVSKCERIPRFFWEWLCMHSQYQAIFLLPSSLGTRLCVYIFVFQGSLRMRPPLLSTNLNTNRSGRSRNKPISTD